MVKQSKKKKKDQPDLLKCWQLSSSTKHTVAERPQEMELKSTTGDDLCVHSRLTEETHGGKCIEPTLDRKNE